MEIFYTPTALRVIKKFSPGERLVFREVVEDVRRAPEAGWFLTGSLRHLRKWKFKMNGVPHRIGYELKRDRIVVVAVGKRKDFYNLLK